ncbi:MAG: gliding motility-associated C-terminal domain-containing protein [Saprospiraceae bacterium]|nr:gliding motility-associated C-terminal domain-containing protein [Saprospiraceae bacterium]
MRLQVGSVPMGFAGAPCNNGIISYSTVDFCLYGAQACNPAFLPTVDCPPSAGPAWELIGSVSYTPATVWSEIVISFTAPYDVNAIMLGPPCVLPSGYNGSPCNNYFLMDGLELEEIEVIDELDLVMDGIPCNSEFSLSASIAHFGGTWQWYYNGVAIPGQEEEQLLLKDNNYLSGIYTVTYTYNGECVSEEIEVNFDTPGQGQEEVFLCPGQSVLCAGQKFYQEGIYEVTISTDEGCDSIVECTVLPYEVPPPTPAYQELCYPANLLYCDELLTESGQYEIPCTNWLGCDSLILLDLVILQPEAVILPPDSLACDSTLSVILDGSHSPPVILPGGTTNFQWSGPPGGLTGPTNNAIAMAKKPGQYCLTVTFAGVQISCSDTSCVVVEQGSGLPVAPSILAPDLLCDSNSIQATGLWSGLDTTTQLVWQISPDAPFTVTHDTSFLLINPLYAQYEICLTAVNECGASAPSCHTIYLGQKNVQYSSFSTCDPAAVGKDTLFLQNQHGCDSLVITETVLLPSSSNAVQLFTCDPAQAGLDTLHLTNQAGCDSTVYVTTIYTGVYQESQTVQICGSGIPWSDTLIVTSGPCDSLFITQYQYTPLDTTLLSGTTCQASQAGTFVQVIPDQTGCDSTVILTVTLVPSDTTLVEGVTCDKANEVYDIQTLTNQWGCDSTVWTSIIYMGIDTQYVYLTSCDPAQTGITTQILTGGYCDTVQVTETTWVPFTESRDTITLCLSNGPASDTTILVGQSGCDSLVIRSYQYTNLTAEVDIDPERCAGDADGQLTVSQIGGGTGPYELRSGTGPWQSATTMGDLVPLVVQASQALQQVQWTATDELSCATCVNAVLGPVSASQTVNVQGWSVDGCPGSDQLEVLVRPRVEVYIPNSFSPNDDGINDWFTVFSNEEGLIVKNLAIFDRWGNALYHQEALSVNDPAQGWDGQFRGAIMDPGVYIYVIELLRSDGTVQIVKGDVTILR